MIGVCKYCGCTEQKACEIRMRHPATPELGRRGMAPGIFACSWLLPDICDAPACVEKAYLDARNSAEELTLLLDEGIRIEFEDVA